MAEQPKERQVPATEADISEEASSPPPPSPNLPMLPDNIILRIFQDLAVNDIVAVGSVHEVLHRVGQDWTLWKPNLNIFGDAMITQVLDLMKYAGRKFVGIGAYAVAPRAAMYNYSPANTAMNLFGEHCPNVERLVLLTEEKSDLRNDTLQLLQTGCPKLKALTLWGVNVDPNLIGNVMSHPSLKELTIYYHPGMKSYGETINPPLAQSGIQFHAMTYLDLTGLQLHDNDLTMLLNTSPGMKGFLWSAVTVEQILIVIGAIPETLTTIGFDIFFAAEEEVPDVGHLLRARGANLRLEEIRISAIEANHFFPLVGNIFGGFVQWPKLKTVACLRRGRWTQDNIDVFQAFPPQIRKLVMHCDLPDQLATTIVGRLPHLEFLHAEVDARNTGRFIRRIVEENRLPELKGIFISRHADLDQIKTELQSLIAQRPNVKVVFSETPGLGRTVYMHHTDHEDPEWGRWKMLHSCVGTPTGKDDTVSI